VPRRSPERTVTCRNRAVQSTGPEFPRVRGIIRAGRASRRLLVATTADHDPAFGAWLRGFVATLPPRSPRDPDLASLSPYSQDASGLQNHQRPSGKVCLVQTWVTLGGLKPWDTSEANSFSAIA